MHWATLGIEAKLAALATRFSRFSVRGLLSSIHRMLLSSAALSRGAEPRLRQLRPAGLRPQKEHWLLLRRQVLPHSRVEPNVSSIHGRISSVFACIGISAEHVVAWRMSWRILRGAEKAARCCRAAVPSCGELSTIMSSVAFSASLHKPRPCFAN